MSLQNILLNSVVIPSEQGLLLFCIALRAAAHSYSDTGPSILFFSSSVSFLSIFLLNCSIFLVSIFWYCGSL